MSPGLAAVYRVRSDASSIEDRARAIAVEQSVEMPVSAIEDDYILSKIVGRVVAIEPREEGIFEVRIALAAETVGQEPGQLVNMLFGNTSIHDDVVLHDAEIPAELMKSFGGPRHGLSGLRQKVGARDRALTGSALKPQGLPPEKLAALAEKFARGGVDYIKDDHGLADQAYSPFAARVQAIAPALRAVEQAIGHAARYVPSLSGDLDGMRASVPTPAGGMSLERVPEMLDFYGKDTMLLIGGALLAERERLVEATAAFVAAVERHGHG